jgi:hypothetical protein
MREQLQVALDAPDKKWDEWNARRAAGKPVLTALEAIILMPHGKLAGGDDIRFSRRLSLAKNHVEPPRPVKPAKPGLRVLLIEGVDYFADRIIDGLVAEGHVLTWIVGEAGEAYSYLGCRMRGLLPTTTGGIADTIDIYPKQFDVALVADVLRGPRPMLEVVRWLANKNVPCIGLTETGNQDAVEAGGAATVMDKQALLGALSQDDFFRLIVQSLT